MLHGGGDPRRPGRHLAASANGDARTLADRNGKGNRCSIERRRQNWRGGPGWRGAQCGGKTGLCRIVDVVRSATAATKSRRTEHDIIERRQAAVQDGKEGQDGREGRQDGDWPIAPQQPVPGLQKRLGQLCGVVGPVQPLVQWLRQAGTLSMLHTALFVLSPLPVAPRLQYGARLNAMQPPCIECASTLRTYGDMPIEPVAETVIEDLQRKLDAAPVGDPPVAVDAKVRLATPAAAFPFPAHGPSRLPTHRRSAARLWPASTASRA